MNIAIPITACTHMAPAPDRYQVHVGNIKLGSVKKHWSSKAIVLFKIHKVPLVNLMTPHAHFYGPSTYGALWYKGKPLTVADSVHNRVLKEATLHLCSKHGQPVPVMSLTHDYLSTRMFIVPVNYSTFHAAPIDDTCVLELDPDRIDSAKIPAQVDCVYTLSNTRLRHNNIYYHKLFVLEKTRNLKLQHGTVKYALVGHLWKPSVIQPATSRDVGACTKDEFINTPERAKKSAILPVISQTSQARVKLDEDFVIDNIAIRIVKITASGYEYKKLLL